jgi:hypothetical protein
MSGVDTRHIARDSLFMMAGLRLAGDSFEHRVKVRNLSAGGMMAEGAVRVERGTRVSVELRNLGWTEGSVAWVQDKRFGIAFAEEIDPKVVRSQVTGSIHEVDTPRFVRPASILPPDADRDPSRFRKI